MSNLRKGKRKLTTAIQVRFYEDQHQEVLSEIESHRKETGLMPKKADVIRAIIDRGIASRKNKTN